MKVSTTRFLPGALTIFALFFAAFVHAQGARISVQGVLQKADGQAIPDGMQTLIFRLYDAASGGSIVHRDTITTEVFGGVYSVVLGANNNNPLTAAFNTTYYLTVTIDNEELLPRVPLTAVPYALALLGQSNVFPNSGNVGVGTATPTAKLQVEGTTALNGAFATKTKTVSIYPYTVAPDDHVLFLSAFGQGEVILPDPTGANANRRLVVVANSGPTKKLTSPNNIDLLFGPDSTTILLSGAIELQSNGSVWKQTGGYTTAADKAYVRCEGGGLLGFVSVSTPVYAADAPFNEITDVGNNFDNYIFTAPRKGIYQVSGYISISNYNLLAPPTSTIFNIDFDGTCDMCSATLGEGIDPKNEHRFNFSTTLMMNEGETFKIRVTSPNSPHVNIFYILNQSSWLTIAEL